MIRLTFHIVRDGVTHGPYRLFTGYVLPDRMTIEPVDDTSEIVLYHPIAGDRQHRVREHGTVKTRFGTSAALVVALHNAAPEDDKIASADLHDLIERYDGSHYWVVRLQETTMSRVHVTNIEPHLLVG
jgi:hypothetical protein